ncbi:UDP-N-acetylmuramoyl-L-alanyl-D-glutamate--2,6-diaminopimelate ligase [Verrucomicrobiales bacterium]|nr:UDP-N-acetylmuramoyl-L-alanyl-D-glutamate--2,6-diaminopimelate ligase [Verrucomicrobiales bacterium]MDB4657803.1 UDP-N-acetylmuramoyl-L-alanyl-D-glutamate--2,6-diaminopimelate ligase [Verrucomicrobiales bacterium]MDB4662651.1 UDP-N-acetylmuramoyl-L-alanyl-D-glutamate--2,6-diaminopimelate ligase [Verrucomicrobiales bacterium]
MKLEDVIKSTQIKSVTGSLNDHAIERVDYDSRQVKPGSLFCALSGKEADGNEFIPKALENGASAILSEKSFPANTSVPWLQVDNARAAMATCAAELYENPSHEMPVVGVTGTNGKTTTAFLIHYLMEASLRRAGMLGTVHYQIADEVQVASRTTPESTDVHRMLREMRDADCRAAVMEVASHGLAQHRVGGVKFAAGVFTNLTQDHLDYHETMDAYFDAKKRLFQQMAAQDDEPTMIVNFDDSYGKRLLKAPIGGVKKLTFGQSAGCDFRVAGIKPDLNGTQFQLYIKGRQLLVKIPLIGTFNVYNCLAALAAAQSINLNVREAISNLENAPQVPGRMEAVDGDRRINYRVFVDYAHTPDALENALKTARDLRPNRLITVFGCGGDRDVRKRPLMGKAADTASDLSILTLDNPRTEDPAKILRDTESGMNGNYKVIEDRREAIEFAISLAGERDIVVIAGKGHEDYQEINGVKHDFDDRKVAGECIRARSED